MTELEHLQAVVDTEADYFAATKIIDSAFALLEDAPDASDPAYYLAYDVANNAWVAADTKYAAWSKAIKNLRKHLKEQDND